MVAHSQLVVEKVSSKDSDKALLSAKMSSLKPFLMNNGNPNASASAVLVKTQLTNLLPMPSEQEDSTLLVQLLLLRPSNSTKLELLQKNQEDMLRKKPHVNNSTEMEVQELPLVEIASVSASQKPNKTKPLALEDELKGD